MSNPHPHGIRHFIDLKDIEARQLQQIMQAAKDLKWERQKRNFAAPLANRKLCMMFEKQSTRTRISFELAITELGGYALSFNSTDLQLGRGETIADTARVMSRYVDLIMLRCHEHSKLLELAQHAEVPVINGLSSHSHPCQVMADILTYEEHRGEIKGKTVAWIGDGNNMANSWISAAPAFGFKLKLACPPALQPDTKLLEWAIAQGASIEPLYEPEVVVKDADLVTTDTWISMGDDDTERRMALLKPYQVTEALMAKAKPDALFMHCLPAHRGEEVTAEVIDGPQSVVFDEAENRLHIQKAILLWCMRVV